MEYLPFRVSSAKYFLLGLALFSFEKFSGSSLRTSYKNCVGSIELPSVSFSPDTLQSPQEILFQDALRRVQEEPVSEWLGNPYIPATFYYSDAYFEKLENDTTLTPHEEIFSVLKSLRDTDYFKNYLAFLTFQCEQDSSYILSCDREAKPLIKFGFGVGKHAHKDAVDLFATHGAPIFAMKSGIVVLAEREWDREDPTSLATTSPRGGNAVIMYHPQDQAFIRYAHLEQVFVSPGDVVSFAKPLGTVGKTGLNAMRAESPDHVHVEENIVLKDGIEYVSASTLRNQILAIH